MMKRVVAFVILSLSVPAFSYAAEGELQAPPIKWNGDLRFRHESIYNEGASPSSFSQQKLRFRVGAGVELNPTTSAEFRLATGPGGTITDQILGQSANGNLGMRLDLAYFDWHGLDGFDFYGGRIKNTFFLPGGSDLIWDNDLNFDGLALVYLFSAAEFNPFITLSYDWINKAAGGVNQDNALITAQLGVRPKIGPMDAAVGVSYYDFTQMSGQTLLFNGFSTPANANSNNGTSYLFDYHLIEVGLEIGLNLMDLPFVISGDFVTNMAASADNTGFLAGFKIGQNKRAGDISLAYDFRQLKKDAAVSAFTDFDAANGSGTNLSSHRIVLAYSFADRVFAAANIYFGTSGITAGQTGLTRNHYQADLNYHF